MNRTFTINTFRRLFRIEVPMVYATPIVFVVDDEASICNSFALLIESAGWHAETFTSAQEFLARPRVVVPSCLILDVAMPDIDGLELQRRVAIDRSDMPIIFVSGCGSVPMSVQAMKAGALEFLTKPVRVDALLCAIACALDRSRATLEHEAETRVLRERHASLSRREREVLELVVAGRLNKQVAGELGISEITVKAHRGKVMQKMKARSFADLVWLAARLGVASPRKEGASRFSDFRDAPRTTPFASNPPFNIASHQRGGLYPVRYS